MMLHRHFEKREEKPVKTPVNTKIQEGQDIVNTMNEHTETAEPVKRGRKRKTEE